MTIKTSIFLLTFSSIISTNIFAVNSIEINNEIKTEPVIPKLEDGIEEIAFQALKSINDAIWTLVEMAVKQQDNFFKLTIWGSKTLNRGILSSAMHIGRELADGNDLKTAIDGCVPELGEEITKDLYEILISSVTLKTLGTLGSNVFGVLFGEIFFSYGLNEYEKEFSIEISKKNINSLRPKFNNLSEQARVYYERGHDLFLKHDAQGALKEINKAIWLNPNYANAYLIKAFCYETMNQFEEAMIVYDFSINRINELLKLDPKNSEALESKAKMHFHKGFDLYFYYRDHVGALRQLTEAIRLDPNYGLAYHLQAVSYENLGQFEEAIVAYDLFISLNPELAWAYFDRALVCLKLNKYQEALNSINELLKREPENTEALKIRGELEENNKEIEYQKALNNAYQKSLREQREWEEKQKFERAFFQSVNIAQSNMRRYSSQCIQNMHNRFQNTIQKTSQTFHQNNVNMQREIQQLDMKNQMMRQNLQNSMYESMQRSIQTTRELQSRENERQRQGFGTQSLYIGNGEHSSGGQEPTTQSCPTEGQGGCLPGWRPNPDMPGFCQICPDTHLDLKISFDGGKAFH